jgi:hypothetical protein
MLQPVWAPQAYPGSVFMIDRRGHAEAPAVSAILVIPGGWSGPMRHLAASIDSLLSQTLRDIEVVVADPYGRADVAALRAVHGGYGDTRLCGETAVYGRYLAFLAAGDIALPTRLALQAAHLDAHPHIDVLSCGTRLLVQGQVNACEDLVGAPAAFDGWRFLLGLAPPLSSVMLRCHPASACLPALERDPGLLLDLCLRGVARGAFGRLDRSLVVARQVCAAPPTLAEAALAGRLAPLYDRLFADRAKRSAALVVRHIALKTPVPDAQTLARLLDIFDALNRDFFARHAEDAAAVRAMREAAPKLWQSVLVRAAAAGTVPGRLLRARAPQGIALPAAVRLPSVPAPVGGSEAGLPPAAFFGIPYTPCPSDPADPPTLFVVVDTEAEFDWAKPFARELTSVSAMDDIGRGQAVFDAYGLRPIYVVDYPIATQARGFATLRAIMERDGCEIGAHLHPWTTPPFEEALSERNSYPGNLDPALEERKLASLMQAIRLNFGISPVFYKAGRYGFGPHTAKALSQHGIRVDLSVLPGADLGRSGGPDFRALKPVLYRIGGTDIVSLPMTRSEVGLLPGLARVGTAVHAVPGGGLLRLPSVLSRLRLADTITLTPEGVTADEQMRLIRAMLKGGCRRFVLHYHSPSLSPGNTPYARDRTGAETLVTRLQTVCTFFFETLGGIPGYPKDLLKLG